MLISPERVRPCTVLGNLMSVEFQQQDFSELYRFRVSISKAFHDIERINMLGAIIGDIVGSVYEWDRIKTKEFPFLTDACFFTDDSVCTIAVADILIHGLPPAETMQKLVSPVS